MQIDELIDIGNIDRNICERMLVQMHALAHTPTHTLLSGMDLKRKGERMRNIYVLEFLLAITQITSKSVKQKRGKNQFLIGEVQGAVKSIIFYFQISFREAYTLSEKSGLAGGQRTSWKWSCERHCQVQGKGQCGGQKWRFHLLWQEKGVGRVSSAPIQIMATRAIRCDTGHLIDCWVWLGQFALKNKCTWDLKGALESSLKKKKYKETKRLEEEAWLARHRPGRGCRTWDGAQPAGFPAPNFLLLPLDICLQSTLPTRQNFDFSKSFINMQQLTHSVSGVFTDSRLTAGGITRARPTRYMLRPAQPSQVSIWTAFLPVGLALLSIDDVKGAGSLMTRAGP